MSEETENITADEIENEYAGLTSKQKSAVDAIAESDAGEKKKEIAHNAGVSQSYLYYVENEFDHLIEYRQSAMRYATDGSGEQYVDVRLTEDEAFKAIRILPAELSQVVYQAVKGGN